MSEGVRDLQSSGGVGELGVIDPSINSVFSRSDAPFLHVIVIMLRLTCQKLESAIFFARITDRFVRKQATKYVRPSIMITLHDSSN